MSPEQRADYVAAMRPVFFAHLATSGQFQAGRPPTVQRGSGKPRERIRQASTAERETLIRSAISTVPTGSQAMEDSVGKVLTPGQECGHNTYMMNSETAEATHTLAYVAQHGARAGIHYGTCVCGWSGPGRRSIEKSVADVEAHIVRGDDNG